MITKVDLEALSEARLVDAQELFKASRFSAAYYLCGYSVELGLKACIAKLFQANTIPEKGLVNAIYSLGLAGLRERLREDMRQDTALSAAWGVASKWNEASRYVLTDQFAAASILSAVGDPTHGVLQWLKKHW